MGKTPPREKEEEGSTRKKAPRVDDPALITASAPSPTGTTPPKGEEAEGSPQKKAPRVDDAAPTTVPGASAPSPTAKTPPKGDEAEGSPRKKAPRLDDAALATVPGASKPNPTGESPPKTSRSPRRQDKRPAVTLPLFPTVPESSELIVGVAGRASDEKRCKCNHVITESTIEELVSSLDSKDAWICCDCRDEDQAGIVKIRPEKSDILICVRCGDHLCCGVGSVAYPFGHSRAHALKKKHWFAVLYCDPERGYCFKCDAEVGLQVIRSIVSRKLLAPPPSVGQTEAEVNPKVEMTGKVQAETHPSGFDLDLADKWPSYESSSSDAQGYAIRGIPNLGNTCYMSAVLQCLFVLRKLRERMLGDRPKGLLPELLKELFELLEASAAGDLLDPTKVLECVGLYKADFRKVGETQDSHEFLMALREIWIGGEKIYNTQSDAPTVIDSIFGFEMLQTLSCKKCGPLSPPVPEAFLDLTICFPSKWHPTKSAASPQTSERSRKREIAVQLFPADVQRNLEMMQTVSKSGYSRAIGSEVTLEVDSTQAQLISQSKDVVQSSFKIQEGKSVDSLTADSVSIEYLLAEDHPSSRRCPNCAKDHEETSASQSKNGEQKVGSGNEDDVGDTVEIYRFATLPPVLALHLNRTSQLGIKISGHVRFKEDLDVKRFMDSRSVDKDRTRYRLAGVVEHIGKGSLKAKGTHYIAYVRARRLGNQQEDSSCSSSWFRADDHKIRQVTLEQVLSCEAYILFYERIEGQDISSMQKVPNDILSCWEIIESDEIVDCIVDPEDPCTVYEQLGDIPLSTRVLYNKYINYVRNVLENNKPNIEMLQHGAAFLGQFSPIIDQMLPIPVCSFAAKASSGISNAMKAGAVMDRALKLLQSVASPPECLAVFSVSNEVQAKDAVDRWNELGRPQLYFVFLEGVDYDEAQAVKAVLVSLQATELLWLFHRELYDE